MATVSTSATKGIYDLELITLEDLLATALQNLNQSKRLDEYLSYLTSEWYTTPEDLRLAYQNDKIWSQITLPGRLKLELIKLIEKATDSQSRPPVTTIDQRIMTTATTTTTADMLKELSPILSEKVPCVATTTTTTTDRVAWTTELDQNHSRAVDHNVELTETDQQIYSIDWSAEVAHDDDVDGGSTVQAAASSSSSFSSEWVCCISQEHHCYYYYNISTLESTWEPPEGVYFESVHAYDEHLQQWIALPDDYDVSNHNNYQDNNNNNNDYNDGGDEYYVQLESYDDVNINIKHHDSGNYNNSTNNDDDGSLHHLRVSSSPSPVKLTSSTVKKRIIIVDVDDDDDSSSDSNGPESPSCNDKMTTILQFNDIYGGVEGGDDDKEADLSPKVIGYRSHFFQSMIDGGEVPVVQIGQHHHHHHQNHHSVFSRSIDAGSSRDDVHDVSSSSNNNNNRPSYDDDNNNLPRRSNNPFDYFGEGGWVFSSDQNDYEWVEHVVADPKDDTVVIDDTFSQYQPTEYYVDEDYDRELVASLQAYEFNRDGDDDDYHEYDDAPSAVGQDASLIAATTSTVDAASEEDKAAKLLFIHPSAPIDDDDDEVGGCRYGEVDPSSPLRINNLFPDEPSMDFRILEGPSPSRLPDQHNDQLFRCDH